MNTVILMSDGTIVHNRKTVEVKPLIFLSYRAKLEEEYTLRSYFQMLEKYPLLADLNIFFPSYMERYRTSKESGCDDDSLDYLELGKTIEMIGFPGKPRMEIFNSFHGIHGGEMCEIKNFQIEDILDMQIRLGRLKHIVLGDKVDVFEFETVFSLFELIDGIAWELSFHGIPKQCELRR